MFNHQYVSLKQVIDKIKRGNLYKELSYEAAIDYGVEAFRLLASDKAEETKPAFLKVSENRAEIPQDLERVLQVIKVDECLKTLQAMRYATDNLASLKHCFNSPDLECISEYTYSMNNSYFITNFNEGHLLVIYKGLPVDEDCIPMIPDNVNVKLAVEYYIKSRFLDDLGSSEPKIERQQQKDEQQYCWYIGKAQGSMTEMTMDEYESFANSMSKFFDSEDYHKSFMKDLGAQELIVNQRYG